MKHDDTLTVEGLHPWHVSHVSPDHVRARPLTRGVTVYWRRDKSWDLSISYWHTPYSIPSKLRLLFLAMNVWQTWSIYVVRKGRYAQLIMKTSSRMAYLPLKILTAKMASPTPCTSLDTALVSLKLRVDCKIRYNIFTPICPHAVLRSWNKKNINSKIESWFC